VTYWNKGFGGRLTSTPPAWYLEGDFPDKGTMMDPRQEEDEPRDLPEGVNRVSSLKARVGVLEYALELLISLQIDSNVSGPDRARLLAAHAMLTRASSTKKRARPEAE